MISRKEQKDGPALGVRPRKQRLPNFLCHKALLVCRCGWMLADSGNFTGTRSPLNGPTYWKEESAPQSFRQTGRTETDDFDTGDIWYFPKGHGHALQCLGDKPCHFLLGCDNGHFSEFGTFSLTDWVSHTSPEVVWRNLCLPVQLVAALPKKELYIGPGKEPSERQPDNINPNTEESQSRHRFRMESMPVSETFAGGWARIVSAKEFPIQTTLTAVRMNIDPGALREMHWHPNADEWQFVMGGRGRVTIFGSHSRVKTMEYGPGQIAFIKQGYGHFVESTGDEPLRLLILFNSATYQEISISQWLAANPPQLVAEHFGLTNEQTALLPMHQLGIIAKNG
jgi:oxalate decarboxylase